MRATCFVNRKKSKKKKQPKTLPCIECAALILNLQEQPLLWTAPACHLLSKSCCRLEICALPKGHFLYSLRAFLRPLTFCSILIKTQFLLLIYAAFFLLYSRANLCKTHRTVVTFNFVFSLFSYTHIFISSFLHSHECKKKKKSKTNATYALDNAHTNTLDRHGPSSFTIGEERHVRLLLGTALNWPTFILAFCALAANE